MKRDINRGIAQPYDARPSTKYLELFVAADYYEVFMKC